MWKRIYISASIILLSFTAVAQFTETNYQGTMVIEGYALNKSYGPFNLGFTFNYYGNDYTQFHVTSNGLVAFGAGSTSRLNVAIPSATTPNNFIAAFWDSLQVDDFGSIMYVTVGAAPNRKCIIQFRNMGFSPYPVFMGTFQVILSETTNKIHVQYRLVVDSNSDRNRGGGATIGIENSGGTAGIQYAYRDANAVETGKAISFTPDGLGSYTLNQGEEYQWVFLTKNISLPEPGITRLVSPAQDAIIGSDITMEWQATTNASYYTLYVSNSPDLADATVYTPGTALTYDVTGLLLDTTYYWGVFATNSTGTSWCELRRFSTSSTPPLAGVPRTMWIEQGAERAARIQYTGGDGTAVSATVTSLPAKGKLYQVVAGLKGSEIVSVPAAVSDTGLQLIYLADGGTGNDAGSFNFFVTDDNGDSPEVKYTINVNPPGVPNVLLAAKSTGVEIQFDRSMNDPSGKEGQFAVTVNGSPVTVTAAALKEGDPYSIQLTLATPLSGGETVMVFYTKGDVSATTGALLETFVDVPAVFLAQTITFPVIPPKLYSDPDHFPGASASGGGLMSYSSSDLQIATIVAGRIHYTGVGSAIITARQNGDATYAPARYDRPLTVSKGNQTITFNPLPQKTYGDADFSGGATTSSGLPAEYSSSNEAVATIVAGMIHITGTGTTTITASQPGNENYNPAAPVNRSLTVVKADQAITFNPLPVADYGDGDITIEAESTSGLPVTLTSSNPAVATISGNVIHITGGGFTSITASQAGDAIFNPAEQVTQIFNVNKVTLTVTAGNKTKPYLDPIPELTFTITGFVLGETITVIDDLPSAQTTATQSSDVGTYPVTFTGGFDNSYDFIYVDGELSITQIEQTITFYNLPAYLFKGTTGIITVSSTSGLTVEVENLTPAIASLSGSDLTGLERGMAQLRAYNEGNINYLPAEAFATVEITTTHRDVLYLFTPNSDGFNDLWEIPGLTELGRCDVRIFNRWGKLIYANEDYNNEWDGTSEGRPVPEGAYVFIISTENAGVIKGTVNIVR